MLPLDQQASVVNIKPKNKKSLLFSSRDSDNNEVRLSSADPTRNLLRRDESVRKMRPYHQRSESMRKIQQLFHRNDGILKSKARRGARAVGFSPDLENVRETLSRQDMSPEERSAYYYTKKENQTMKMDAERVAKNCEDLNSQNAGPASAHSKRRFGRMRRSHQKRPTLDRPGDEDEKRGLEQMTRSGKLLSKANVKYAVETVLTKQSEQRRFQIDKKNPEESLASVYKMVCASCKEEALVRGKHDFEVLQEETPKKKRSTKWRKWHSSRNLSLSTH